jgi:hypothetical protein
MFCALAALLSACAQQTQPDIADTEPIKPDQDPWERVGTTMAKKQAATR